MLSNVSVAALVDRHFGLLQTINEQPRCDLVPLHDPKLVQLINFQCRALMYRVLNTNNGTSCYIHFSSIGSTNIWHSMSYFIDFKKACPLGFDSYNGVCECNKQLKAVFPSLTCDIDRLTFVCSGYIWIGLSNNKQNILYVSMIHLIVVTWPRVFCLICTPESRGPQARGMRVYISGRTRVHMLQLLCNTSMASLYLYRHLLHSIMIFK